MLIGAVVAMGYGARWGIAAYRAALVVTGLSDDPAPVHLTIGDETIVVPGNMLREAAARAGGEVKRAELVLHWPTLEGYSPALARDFVDGTPSAPLVYATVAPRSIGLDAEARLDSVYADRFVGEPLPAPDGLSAHRLGAESGYGGEVVYYSAPGPGRFVARCVSPSTPEIPATCLRDFDMGRGLAMLYRFNRQIIGDWAALDGGMRALAARIVPQ
jgi:hypothetical protein